MLLWKEVHHELQLVELGLGGSARAMCPVDKQERQLYIIPRLVCSRSVSLCVAPRPSLLEWTRKGEIKPGRKARARGVDLCTV